VPGPRVDTNKARIPSRGRGKCARRLPKGAFKRTNRAITTPSPLRARLLASANSSSKWLVKHPG